MRVCDWCGGELPGKVEDDDPPAFCSEDCMEEHDAWRNADQRSPENV